MDFRGKNIDLVGKQNLWFGISLALILVGLVSWRVFGLNLGIDFKGGGQFQYRIPLSQRPAAGQEVALLKEASGSLEQQGLRRARLQIAGGNTLVINTDARNQSELPGQQRRITEALGARFKGTDAENRPAQLRLIGQQFVGPVIGKELKNSAIKGVILGVLCIALWIWIRYSFIDWRDGLRYAVAGIVALVHDVLVLIGLFALIGKIDPRVEIDGAFIAALLTVVGYSINDSVVIFDRLRENLKVRRKEPFNTVINDSLLETMSRSINTGLTVLIMLFVLLLLGGESIYNFVLAMLVGIASGLYSSIFNASMVLTAWHGWDEKKQAQARQNRAAGAMSRAAARSTTTRASGAQSGMALSTSAPAGSTSGSAPRRSTFATAGATRPLPDVGAPANRTNGSSYAEQSAARPTPPSSAGLNAADENTEVASALSEEPHEPATFSTATPVPDGAAADGEVMVDGNAVTDGSDGGRSATGIRTQPAPSSAASRKARAKRRF